MHTFYHSVSAFVNRQRLRLGVYAVVIALIAASGIGVASAYEASNDAAANAQGKSQSLADYKVNLEAFKVYQASVASYKEKGIDVSVAREAEIRRLLASGDYSAAEAAMSDDVKALEAALTGKQADEAAKAEEAKKAQEAEAARLAEEEAQKATVKGKVTFEGKGVEGVVVGDGVTSGTTDASGAYSFRLPAGNHGISAVKSGYVTAKASITLATKQELAKDFVLTKLVAATPKPTATPKSTAAPSGGTSNEYGSYERRSVATSRGTFTADILTIDLTKARVYTDTAADSECDNGCPAKSLQSYVQGFGGFAGINGTYFCPPDYAECASKTNTFYWKVWNSRLGRDINASNGGGELDPYLAFGADGSARYFTTWQAFRASGYQAVAGISCKPRLVEGGGIALVDSDMDSKQRSTKSNRGGIGINGQTLYAVVAKSATVPDLAAVMQALGAQYALNLDGGGSSAMYFNGYKVGPGRALPNAVVFGPR